LNVWYKRLLVRASNPEKYILDFYQKLSITMSFFLRNELRNHAAAVTYYMLLSLIPLILLLFFIFDTFLESYPQFSENLFYVLRLFNENLSPEFFEKFGISKKAGSAIGVFGVLNLLFSSRLILASVQRAFSVIFPAEKKRNFLLENAISLGALPAVFVFVLIAGVINSAKAIILTYLETTGIDTHLISPAMSVLNYVLPAGLAFIFVYFLYRNLPVRKPSHRSALKGALLFLAVFVTAKLFVYKLISEIASNSAYGLLGSLIVILIWGYFVFLLFFFCAQYVFVAYKADVLILNRLFSDGENSHRFMLMNKKILEKYTENLSLGHTLFELGDDSEKVYYLMQGSLDVWVNERMIGQIKAGEVFGEMAYITGEPRSATVKASEDSEVVVLPPKVFDEIMKDNHDLARRVMETLCARLKKAQFMGRFSG